MLRFLPTLCLALFSVSTFAGVHPQVQVDVIIFTHTYTEKGQEELAAQTEVHDTHTAIPLRARESGEYHAYQLMSPSHSKLQPLWTRLSRAGHYQPLFHYTWTQPTNNQSAVSLPQGTSQGWTVHGTIRVRQSNYYLLDTLLEFKATHHATASFVLSQKMRLKPGNTYYLDHPQGGMLINVHRV